MRTTIKPQTKIAFISWPLHY